MHDETTGLATAADTLARLVAIAAADPQAFLEVAAGDESLIADVIRLSTENSFWLETVLGALRREKVSVKAQDKFASIIKTQVKEQQKAKRAHLHEVDPDAGPPSVKDALPSAPVSDDAVIPAGYQLKLSGITTMVETKDGAEQRRVADAPVVISGRMMGTADQSEMLYIAFMRDGRWKTVTIPRDTAMNSRKLIDVAKYGLPIHSGSAGALARYLSEYESINADVIPKAKVSPHLGWQEDAGKPTFLFGNRLMTGDGQDLAEIDLEALPPSEWQEDWITFSGADAGDQQLVRAYRAKGTFEEWQKAIAVVEHYPKVQLALFAAFAAPLLHILDANSFLVDLCGTTSQGKSIALMVAGSVDGNPDLTTPNSVVATWNATKVFIERRAALLNGLSLCLDDTKQARRKDDVADTIYLVAGGQGRGRGSLQGMRQSGSWRVVLISTGEMPAVSHSQAGGTRARAITVWGSPFEETSPETAVMVNRLAAGLKRNHGHAGPRFVQYLLAHQDEWDAWREIYREAVDDLIAKSSDNTVAGRLAASFAVIRLAGELAHDAGLIPWESNQAIACLWDQLASEAKGADRAAEALRDVFSWAASRENQFFGRLDLDGEGNPRIPSSGALGAWSSPGWDSIGFTRHALREFLEKQGYDVEGVIREWADRGWLQTSLDHGAKAVTKVFRMGRQTTRGYVITSDAFESVVVSEPEEDQS